MLKRPVQEPMGFEEDLDCNWFREAEAQETEDAEFPTEAVLVEAAWTLVSPRRRRAVSPSLKDAAPASLPRAVPVSIVQAAPL